MTATLRQIEAALSTFRIRTGDLCSASAMGACLEAAERERIAEQREACSHPQRFGKGAFNDDGTMAVDWTCSDCGKTWKSTEHAYPV